MANKWIFVGILLIAAIVVLGCAQKQETEEETAEEPVAAAPIVVEKAPQTPLYQAPLEGSKIKKTCTNDSDCRLILVQTGAGQTRECISTASGYEGRVSAECYCKYISSTTQSLINGTDLVSQNYECRHIA